MILGALALAATPAANAVLAEQPVIASLADEAVPTAGWNTTGRVEYIEWSRNSAANPSHYDAFLRSIRHNLDGTTTILSTVKLNTTGTVQHRDGHALLTAGGCQHAALGVVPHALRAVAPLRPGEAHVSPRRPARPLQPVESRDADPRLGDDARTCSRSGQRRLRRLVPVRHALQRLRLPDLNPGEDQARAAHPER